MLLKKICKRLKPLNKLHCYAYIVLLSFGIYDRVSLPAYGSIKDAIRIEGELIKVYRGVGKSAYKKK